MIIIVFLFLVELELVKIKCIYVFIIVCFKSFKMKRKFYYFKKCGFFKKELKFEKCN